MAKLKLQQPTCQLIVALIMCLTMPQNLAVEMSNMEVKRKGKRYYLDSTLLVNAPVESMYRILSDYNSLHQFSRGIVHSQDITPDALGQPRVYTHIYGCIAFFCRSVEKVERIELDAPHRIVTTLDPALSHNVKWNITSWELDSLELPNTVETLSENNRTRIHYRMEFEPDFWVPPLLGNYLLKRSLKKDGLEIMQRMEAYAQGLFEVDPEKNSIRAFPQFNLLDPDLVKLQKDAMEPADSKSQDDTD